MNERVGQIASATGHRSEARHELFYESLESGLTSYYLSGLIVVLGVALGLSAFELSTDRRSPQHRAVPPTGDALLDALVQWDGQWHLEIALEGYTYDPRRGSSVAFFPVYPLLVGTVHRLTRMPISLAGLVVSHASLFASLLLMFVYVRHRFSEAPKELAKFVLVAFVFFPATFFFRMAYTEPVFVFLCLLSLWAMENGWPAVVTALIMGLATATRSAGVALVLPLMLHVWQRSKSKWRAAGRLAYLGPIACWGLLGYMFFQYLKFGDALAFVQTQQHWRERPPVELTEKLMALLTLEPIWSVYVPSIPGSWWGVENSPSYLFSLRFANPVFFLLGVALILLGARRRWLSRYELLLAAGLLAIGYFGRGHEMCMQSQGRFVAAVFPIYLVLGNILCRVSTLLAGGLVGLSALYLAIYSAMLAAGYVFI